MLGRLLQLVLVYLMVAGSVHAASQPPTFPRNPLNESRFESVGVGVIPRAVVPTMVQDKSGFMWVATGDGLVRYDGYRFRPQERESSDPLTRNLGWIQAMLAGRDGRVWIGTESQGLAVYDPSSDRVSLYGSGKAVPNIRALAQDHEDAIWIGSVGSGLERLEPGSGKRTIYRHTSQSGSLPDDRVSALLVDRQGTLWVGTSAGLSRLNSKGLFEPVPATKDSKNVVNVAGRLVQALYEASDGRIWIGTQSGDVAVIDPTTLQGSVVNTIGSAATSGQGAVTSFVEAPEQQMWIGRDSGIDIVDAQSGTLIKRQRHDIRKPSGLAGNFVTTLMRDQAGWIWVAGLGIGLQRHDPNNQSLWVRGSDTQADSPFANASTHGLLQLDNGEIWAATEAGGAAVMDAQLNVIGALRPKPKEMGGNGAAQRVLALAQTVDGTVWLGANNALYQFNRERRQLKVIPFAKAHEWRFFAGSEGTLWIGTQDGLYRLRPGATAPVQVAQKDGEPLGGVIHALAEAVDKSLWVGSSKGLFRIAAGESNLQAVPTPDGAGLGNPIVIGLLFDRQQTLWVDTAVAGLHRMTQWDGQRASFDRISQRHGILNRPFGVNLLQDKRGRIWTHMYVYDPVADQMHALTATDGADLGTGWFRSYARASDGRFLFGGSKGLLVVHPELFSVSDYPPPLVTSEIQINGQRQLAEKIEAGLLIRPEHRSFSVEFAALDYSEPGHLRYAYQLQGFDPDWIATGASARLASYSNLDPGQYLLRVRATNRSGQWSPHELSVNVQVLPAWWQTWLFRSAVILMLGTSFYAGVQWRTRRARARRRELERTVQERTIELEVLTLALQRESAALKEASLSDPLTGLRNRRFLSQHIEGDTALAVRAYEGNLQYGAPLPVDADLIFFMFDIDHFKSVNDHHGHAAGDEVIVQMHNRLKEVFRDTDYLVRWGGEEFLVVARGTSRSHAAELAERARALVANHPFALSDGTLLDKTISIGFSCFPLSTQHARALDWAAMITIADAALYTIKNSGRNGWLGALSADGVSDKSIRAWLHQPLVNWVRSGELQVVGSNPQYADATVTDGAVSGT